MTSTRVASLFVYLSIRIRTSRHTPVYVVRTRETRCDSKKNASRDDSFFVNASWALHRVTTSLVTIHSTSRVYRRGEGLLARFERRHTSASVDARRARAEPRSRARGSCVVVRGVALAARARERRDSTARARESDRARSVASRRGDARRRRRSKTAVRRSRGRWDTRVARASERRVDEDESGGRSRRGDDEPDGDARDAEHGHAHRRR